MRRIRLLSVFLILLAFCEIADAKTVILTVDARNWYPFTYQDGDKSRGMHIDVVRQALENLGYALEILAYPRKRCFLYVERGTVDGMISVSYHPELAAIMEFPPDAAVRAESDWRIMQVDHMVVTTDSNYEFDGNLKNLPNPVRLPLGESLALRLLNAGKKIDEAKTDLQNFRKMLRDKDGVVITTSIIAEKMELEPEFAGEFYIQSTPAASQSYFLAFSENASLTGTEKKKILDEIKKLREDYVFMLQVFAQH